MAAAWQQLGDVQRGGAARAAARARGRGARLGHAPPRRADGRRPAGPVPRPRAGAHADVAEDAAAPRSRAAGCRPRSARRRSGARCARRASLARRRSPAPQPQLQLVANQVAAAVPAVGPAAGTPGPRRRRARDGSARAHAAASRRRSRRATATPSRRSATTSMRSRARPRRQPSPPIGADARGRGRPWSTGSTRGDAAAALLLARDERRRARGGARQRITGPSFPQPMYEALRDLSPELLLPGVGKIAARHGHRARTATRASSRRSWSASTTSSRPSCCGASSPAICGTRTSATSGTAAPADRRAASTSGARGGARRQLRRRRRAARAADPRRAAAPLSRRADLRRQRRRTDDARDGEEAARLPRPHRSGHHVPRLRLTSRRRRTGWFFVIQEQPSAPRFGLDEARDKAFDDLERPRVERHAHAAGRAPEDRATCKSRRRAPAGADVGVQQRAHGRDPAPAPGARRLPRRRRLLP